jgi:hypothetical protein
VVARKQIRRVMEVNIGEVNSTVRATDNASLLSSEMMERIVRAVMARVRDEDRHRDQVDSERRLSASVSEEPE